MSAKSTRIVIGAVSGGLALILGIVAVVIALPSGPEQGEAADFATEAAAEPWGTDGGFDEFSLFDAAWAGINDAMQENDREAFLSYASGDAVDQLALWWDNTKAIGWETGFMQPYEAEDGGTQPVLVGVDLAFTASPLRGSGREDAGQKLAHGTSYTVETSGEGEELKITSFVPENAPNPWDSGPVYAQRRDHVVLFGIESEKDLVDATVDEAEEAAVLALDTAKRLGADVPQEGFVAAITDDKERFDDWQYGPGEPGGSGAAAIARTTVRPYFPSDLIDPSIATGDDNGGSYVVMGPDTADWLLPSFVHEFGHVMHYAAVPDNGMFKSSAVLEGFARYMELASGAADRDLVTSDVRALVTEHGENAMSDERFASDDIGIAYDAAGSYYEFVAESGGDPWQLAVNAKSEDSGLAVLGSLPMVGAKMDPAFSGENWIAWVQAQ